MSEKLTRLQQQLFVLQDEEYRDFHSKLMPNIPKEDVIGIRVPVLRKFAKEFAKSDEKEKFLKELPHRYYEENNLHMMLLVEMKDYDGCMQEMERFLPYINNWATCDFPAPKCFEKHKKDVLEHIKIWIKSSQTYTVRYAIGMLMRLFLEDDFSAEYPQMVAEVSSEEYYINMMIAWYFATALAKQWDAVIPYIEQRKLSPWVHRKTIQKAVESYRITPGQKEYLKSFRT
ncbi:uncharacterized protein BN724_00837 [Clostridium sp. CAG:590]|nr:uncharacterized protein BN724_00837 [Clostridium sp. CAG:590]